jgi:hypothetical protein
MTVPTLAQAKEFFLDDVFISAISDSRITYWINDIAAKEIIDSNDFGKLYFNAFMNMLGHYLLIYETNTVSYRGVVISEHTAQVSRGFKALDTNNPMYHELSMTKYGLIYLSLLSRLAVVHGGFVATSGGYV